MIFKRGLYVGRFQPFHKGHLEAIRWILSQVEELIIVIGSAQYSHDLENPFKAGERFTMIRRALDEAQIPRGRYEIIAVPDLHVHALWVAHVISYTPKFEVVFTNEPLTRRLFLEYGRFAVRQIPFFKRDIYSATEIRRRILQGEDWEKLVPISVAEYIKEIDGVGRIQDLVKSDKPSL
ncbi:nicotinamide-nucleotide adenylyltransferase [Candidatus Bathyarchaeota archaeon]|nr:nicotinamide-nucleotide adenylyltransferase [Candidatus Bathyarchaeota archaeon]MBS7627592.1 nicotinamide-nucleotide adenylyltransferase [Candidatus Bathyarchaeota archaeon]